MATTMAVSVDLGQVGNNAMVGLPLADILQAETVEPSVDLVLAVFRRVQPCSHRPSSQPSRLL